MADALKPAGRRGKAPTFYAKIGTMPGTTIVTNGVRKFEVGQRLEYADTANLQGMHHSVEPRWETGKVWQIADNRVFLNRI